MSKSKYTYQVDGNVLFIEDLDSGMTVTNNIENVLEEISEDLGTSMQNYDVIYRDTDGLIDGVTTKDGKFEDFYLIRTADYFHAKLNIRK